MSCEATIVGRSLVTNSNLPGVMYQKWLRLWRDNLCCKLTTQKKHCSYVKQGKIE